MISTAADQLPLREVLEPEDQQQLLEIVKRAVREQTPIYPLGGCTSLDFGLPATSEGIGLSLKKLDRVVDYPARDMTITVEAGITMRQLSEQLAEQRQQFPIDAPRSDQATLGGVVAANFNGPRCFGMGGVRDFVIGISAVDGTGAPFKGGGRVVKNVAGYDFCKLLTGSLGTLAVITQLTLKLRPQAEKRAVVTTSVNDLAAAERLLANLVNSDTRPVGVELLSGPAWESRAEFALSGAGQCAIAVLLEGAEVEVDWMVGQLEREWAGGEAGDVGVFEHERADGLLQAFTEFPSHGDGDESSAAFPDSPLVLKAQLKPSGVTDFVQAVREVDIDASLLAHAGDGTVIARLSKFPEDGLSRTLIARLQPAAAAHSGHVAILSNKSGNEMTHQSVWGSGAPFDLMTDVKKQFDPQHLLNPGRFVYLTK